MQDASFLGSTRSWPDEVEHCPGSCILMRVARAAALRAEILCHALGREWVAAQVPQSGLTNGTQLWWGGKQAILSQGCQKICKWLSYLHNMGIAPLHWVRPHKAAKPAINTAHNYSQWVQTLTPRLRTDINPLPMCLLYRCFLDVCRQAISLPPCLSSYIVGRW